MAARASSNLSANISLVGAAETVRALRKLPSDAKDEVKVVSGLLAQDLAESIQSAAAANGPRSMLLGRTVKARRGLTPTIAIGGSAGLSTRHGRVPAYKLLFGDEFGAGKQHDKYSPHGFGRYIPNPKGRGGEGRWIFPTVYKHQSEISEAWLTAADRVIEEFNATE